MTPKKVALIIGAGPAGLTAALELLRHTDIKPIVLEATDEIGGISRTVNHHGNRIDIGGHRFFSKSDWVMNWWRDILPIDQTSQPTAQTGKRMLVRSRLSRIYYLRKFFDYPIRLSLDTVRNLGLVRMAKIGCSYLYARLFPRKPEKSLEDFIINRFGYTLYLTFFKDYTEKVWGVPCHEISAEWGAQRIKGLSITAALKHAFGKLFSTINSRNKTAANTSLIEQFLYPEFGPGQMWEEVARQITEKGGEIRFRQKAVGVQVDNGQVAALRVLDMTNQSENTIPCDLVFSTMPVRDLITAIGQAAPSCVQSIASVLPYRDFITVGLLVPKMKSNAQSRALSANNMPPDNWIYVQESDVNVGRLQIFNNWSPGMVKDPTKIWMGLEYFCNEGDELWNLTDDELKQLAAAEMLKIGLMDPQDVEDSIVIRVPKAYPAYFGAYAQLDTVRRYLNSIGNLYLIGRNGMHRYNNQDHSMLTAKVAVENVMHGISDKSNIWAVNIDDEYHEEKRSS